MIACVTNREKESMNSIAHIAVDYSEKDGVTSYKGVKVICRSGKSITKCFMTGDFPNDYMSATIFVMHGDYAGCMLSSSVDHFTMDANGEFAWHSNGFVGEYPVRAATSDGCWDKLNAQRVRGKGRRNVHILSGGDVVVVDQGRGKFRIFTPDGDPIEKSGPLVEVLGNAARMKRKVVWEETES